MPCCSLKPFIRDNHFTTLTLPNIHHTARNSLEEELLPHCQNLQVTTDPHCYNLSKNAKTTHFVFTETSLGYYTYSDCAATFWLPKSKSEN
jgi:hypothetical protein